MYYRKLIFAFICLFLSNILIAQNYPKDIPALEKKYSNFFHLKRQAAYLHLNKTLLAHGENLWFAGYLYNPESDLPDYDASNLKVVLYNAEGEALTSKTIFVEGGKGSGYFALDKNEFGPGTYYIQASTRYMSNFQEDLSFLQSFNILGEYQEESKPQDLGYDLQLLPEGGHLLAGVKNNIGVKIIDPSGDGVQFKEAYILDSKENKITSFKSNRFGISKFNLIPKEDEVYKLALIMPSGKKIEKEIDKPESEGLTLTANELQGTLMIDVKTNQNTPTDYRNQKFILAIHQDSHIKEYAFHFPEGQLEAKVDIPQDSLFPGVNTITVFDQELKPLLERLVFNDKKLKRIGLTAEVTADYTDSLEIHVNSRAAIKANSLSISVLPGETRSYTPQHNILSAFRLKPYLKGKIEDPAYYFQKSKDKRRRLYDLDLLLLTQGWSKYSWNDIFNDPPKELYEAEKGFSLKGHVNNKKLDEGSRIFFKSKKAGLFKVIDVNNERDFNLDHLFLLDSSSISVGLISGRRNKLVKPAVYATVLPNKDKEALSKNTLELIQHKALSLDLEANNSDNRIPPNFISTAQNLDTIHVEGSSKTKEEIQNMLDPTGQTEIISERTAKIYPSLTNYLRNHGYKIYRDRVLGELTIYTQRLGAFSHRELKIPIIYLDNNRLEDFSLLEDLTMSEIESVYINKTSGGVRGRTTFGGVIKIKTKKGFNPGGSVKNKDIYKFITNNGYAQEKEFYAPKYTSYLSKEFEKYGVIDWFPDVFLDQNGNLSFKIMNTLQPSIKLFIEGITEDGGLISEEILVPTETKNP